jgi:hypothetical protein
MPYVSSIWIVYFWIQSRSFLQFFAVSYSPVAAGSRLADHRISTDPVMGVGAVGIGSAVGGGWLVQSPGLPVIKLKVLRGADRAGRRPYTANSADYCHLDTQKATV